METRLDIERGIRSGRVAKERDTEEAMLTALRVNAASVSDPNGNPYVMCGYRIRTDIVQYLCPDARPAPAVAPVTLADDAFEDTL